jgi:hypothetical protein
MEVHYWPPEFARRESLDVFEAVFATMGYSPCKSMTTERGLEKLALYGAGGKPKHVARMLPKGKWTSKLGLSYDVEHTADALTGHEYGTLLGVYCRPITK